MKRTNLRKGLSTLLMTTMLLSSALVVNAASGGSSGSSGSDKKEASTGTAIEANNGGGYSVPASSSAKVVSSNAKITVAGTTVRTTVAGAYDVKTVQGAAVTTPAANVSANLGLSSGQTPYIMVFDTNAKKSNLAMDCVNAAAEALKGTTVATLNVNLGAKQNGRLITLSQGSIGMVVGLPKNADTSKQYSIVCVQPGGAVTIFEDQDASPATVTFEVKAGLGTYGIVAR